MADQDQGGSVAYDQALAERVRALLEDCDVSERNMFGTRGFMVDGSLALSVRAEGLLVRVGTAGIDDAIERGARQAQMGKRMMKGWVHVTPRDDAELAAWVKTAVAARET
jgi:TfoX/Sxy family transcriptional regulator of competence genes